MSDRSSEGYTGEGYVRRPPDPHKFDFQTAELIVERFKKEFELSADVKTIDDVVAALDGRLYYAVHVGKDKRAKRTSAEEVRADQQAVLGHLHQELGLQRPLWETNTIEKMVAAIAADDERLASSVAEDERRAVLWELGLHYGFKPNTVEDVVAEIDRRMERLEQACDAATELPKNSHCAQRPPPAPGGRLSPEGEECAAAGTGGWHSDGFYEGLRCKWCGARLAQVREDSAPLEEKDRAEAAALLPGVRGVATKPRDSTQRGRGPQAPKGPASHDSPQSRAFCLALRSVELQLSGLCAQAARLGLVGVDFVRDAQEEV